MNRTIVSRLINFLPITGMFILVFSLFMEWFSCGRLGQVSYVDWVTRGMFEHGGLNFYSFFYSFYFLCLFFATYFLFASYFSNKAGINKYFILFLVILFPAFLWPMWEASFMAAVGYHSTIDFPCDMKPGVWLHIFGFVVILIGGCFRVRRNA